METGWFVITYLSTSALVGLVIYFVFYVMMQKYVASKTPSQQDEVSVLPVMGGFIYDEPGGISVTKVVKDILRRAVSTRGIARLERLVGDPGFWYILGLIALTLILLLGVARGG